MIITAGRPKSNLAVQRRGRDSRHAQVTPSLHVLYKHTQIKQYHKHGRALRTETTINQTTDFGLGKRLTNLPALQQGGYTANRRLLAVQRLSHDPITGASVLHSACDPVVHDDGTRVAGLRLTDPRAQALLHILLIFRLHPGGFLNKDLRELLAEYLGRPPGTITPGQATTRPPHPPLAGFHPLWVNHRRYRYATLNAVMGVPL